MAILYSYFDKLPGRVHGILHAHVVLLHLAATAHGHISPIEGAYPKKYTLW